MMITLDHFKDILLTLVNNFDFFQDQGDVTRLLSGVLFDQEVVALPKRSTW